MPNLCILKLNITHSVTKDLSLVMLEILYFFAFTRLLEFLDEEGRFQSVLINYVTCPKDKSLTELL